MADETEFVAAKNASTEGEFVRDATYINDRVVKGLEPGSDPVGEKIGEMRWPVEAGRYRLMAARACPWASRTIIVRRLMGLEDAISLGLASPTTSTRGPSTSIPAARTRSRASSGCRPRTSTGSPTIPGASRCPRWSTYPPRPW